jgi:hypothetical protein
LLLAVARLRHHLSVHVHVVHGTQVARLIVHVFIHFLNHAEGLLLSALEVGIFTFLDPGVDAVDFKLVGVHLRLVVLQLNDHLLELLAAFLQILLVNHQLLSDFGSALLGQDVFELDVKLFFLLDENIFL